MPPKHGGDSLPRSASQKSPGLIGVCHVVTFFSHLGVVATPEVVKSEQMASLHPRAVSGM